MKHRTLYRFLAVFMLLCLAVTAMVIPASAKTGKLQVNTEERHIPCTELSAQAEEYYTGEYTYEKLSALEGVDSPTDSWAATQNNPLYDSLQKLMTDTHVHECVYGGYSANALATCWKSTDAVKGHEGFQYFYADIPEDEYPKSLNREHIWPKSKASFMTKGGGADLHHLRPSIASVNKLKNHYTFDWVEKEGAHTPGSSDPRINNAIWERNEKIEVQDCVKGDVARIILYVYCRWGQPNLYSDVPADKLPPLGEGDKMDTGERCIEGRDVLLEWCAMDPVDTWEMERNNQTENVQGNRNVFIDYPELAWYMFGLTPPADMTTPSGEAARGPAYDVKVVSANEAMGTAELNGMVITAKPIPGFEVTDFKVSPEGAAKVTQNGNTLTVAEVKKDCVITVYFGKIKEPVDSFTDCPDGWYRAPINYVVKNGLMGGTGEGIFAPEETLTRGMVATVLYRSAGSPKVDELSTFEDVPAGEWYAEPVAWAQDNEIINGVDEGSRHFAPEDAIKREDIAVILYRWKKPQDTGEADFSKFTDVDKIDSYAKDAMNWAVGAWILNGDEGRLKPQDFATRAEFAAMIARVSVK